MGPAEPRSRQNQPGRAGARAGRGGGGWREEAGRAELKEVEFGDKVNLVVEAPEPGEEAKVRTRRSRTRTARGDGPAIRIILAEFEYQEYCH